MTANGAHSSWSTEDCVSIADHEVYYGEMAAYCHDKLINGDIGQKRPRKPRKPLPTMSRPSKKIKTEHTVEEEAKLIKGLNKNQLNTYLQAKLDSTQGTLAAFDDVEFTDLTSAALSINETFKSCNKAVITANISLGRKLYQAKCLFGLNKYKNSPEIKGLTWVDWMAEHHIEINERYERKLRSVAKLDIDYPKLKFVQMDWTLFLKVKPQIDKMLEDEEIAAYWM